MLQHLLYVNATAVFCEILFMSSLQKTAVTVPVTM